VDDGFVYAPIATSWFNQVCPNPPIISIACSNASSSPVKLKDTAANIVEGAKKGVGFTVNIISEAFIQQANACSIDAPADKSEWVLSGLTMADSVSRLCSVPFLTLYILIQLSVKAPRVLESAFSMECELFQAIPIVNPSNNAQPSTLILGVVKHFHIRKDVLATPSESGGHGAGKIVIDPAKLKPVSRMGDVTYARLGDGFRIPRPAWSSSTGEGGKTMDEVYEGLGEKDTAAL
jgi:flavin reductase (DIM6/NTAB) family NADH-FMN oxidoreductase RutF